MSNVDVNFVRYLTETITFSSSKLSDGSLQSFDEDIQRKAYRKNNSTHLPIPYHVRASSTPIQSDSHSKEVSHKRFPSYVDTSTITELKKDQKKMSLDNLSKSHENFAKKSTGTGEKLQKHSLDEGRLMSSPDSGSKKNYTSNAPNTIQATPQLLAELLKGSSERLVSEQLQSNQRITSSSLPTAVLKCLVSFFFKFLVLPHVSYLKKKHKLETMTMKSTEFHQLKFTTKRFHDKVN